MTESKVCIAIDKLRQEATKTGLDKGLVSLNKLLDNLHETYKIKNYTYTSFIHYNCRYVADCQNELKIVNKYPEMIREETELLIKELRQFLNAYPKTIGEIRRASRCTIPEEPDVTLPAQMKMCEYEVLALNNWMLG